MRRLLPLVLLVALAVPAHAGAATPCRNKIFNDWYADGKIPSSYARGCYVDALKHIPPDAAVYSSLADDIHSAMRAPIRRAAGKEVAKEVGKGFSAASGQGVLAADPAKAPGPTPPRSAARGSAPIAVGQ